MAGAPAAPSSALLALECTGYGKWFRGTRAGSRPRDTGFSAIRKSVPATSPESVYSQRAPATSHGSKEGSAWGAKPTPRLQNELRWLDTHNGHHDVRLPGLPSTPLGPGLWQSPVSTSQKRALERSPRAHAA